jgi:hypothetical protein
MVMLDERPLLEEVPTISRTHQRAPRSALTEGPEGMPRDHAPSVL